ncbi:hypothetical protein E8E11_005001 [Didymella keratinophila]|nr:hypothetical protein E8E11_005001 [Didymella keratinophila]
MGMLSLWQTVRDESLYRAPHRQHMLEDVPCVYPGPNVASRDENARLGSLTNVKNSPNKLSIVNIPQHIEEEQVRELAETMGKLNAFVLARALPLLYRRTAQRVRSNSPSSLREL